MTKHRTFTTSSASSSKTSSSKAVPIDIPSRRSTSNTYGSSPSSSVTNTKTFQSPTEMTPPASPFRPGYDKRKSSDITSNSHSHSHSQSPHRRRISDDYRRYSGTVNHCGRHSNEWLFGGFSFRDTVRDGVDRLKQHHQHQNHHQEQHHRQEYQQQSYHDRHG